MEAGAEQVGWQLVVRPGKQTMVVKVRIYSLGVRWLPGAKRVADVAPHSALPNSSDDIWIPLAETGQRRLHWPAPH